VIWAFFSGKNQDNKTEYHSAMSLYICPTFLSIGCPKKVPQQSFQEFKVKFSKTTEKLQQKLLKKHH
jgi:hypothetical protein